MMESADVLGSSALNARIESDHLLEEIGLDRDEIEWRKEFIGFDAADERRLRRFRESFDEHAERIATAFYENVTAYEETAAILTRSQRTVDGLERTQRAYLRTLADGDYDESYFQTRARIGKLHDALDMPMNYYIGQYGVYYDLLEPIVVERITDSVAGIVDDLLEPAETDGGTATRPVLGPTGASGTAGLSTPGIDAEELERRIAGEVEAGVAEFTSVMKLLNLDVQVAVDTYLHSYVKDLESTLECQQSVASDVQEAITELGDAADDVAASADQVSELADDGATRTEHISGEVSNVSATVEEIAATTDDVLETGQTADDLAKRGREHGEAALEVMDAIDDASDDVTADLTELRELVDEIDAALDVIDDIADQTNLLALNASIEAARAGHAGDGFAVVADEVKSLAEESRRKAGEIDELLESVKRTTESTAERLDRTNEHVDDGVAVVTELRELLADVSQAVGETVDGIEEVTEATADGAASTEEIASLVDDTHDRTRDIADEIDQVATAVDEQASRVHDVETSITRLQAGDEARRMPAGSRAGTGSGNGE